MRRFLHLLLCCQLLFAPPAWGQEGTEIPGDESSAEPAPVELQELQINAPEAVEVEKKVIFSAAENGYLPDQPVAFRWDLGDGNTTQEGPEVVHTYSETGEFTVTLTVIQNETELTATKSIFVFDTTAVLVITKNLLEENSEIVEQAKANGVFLKTIVSTAQDSAVIEEEQLIQKMQEERDTLASAQVIIFWTPSSPGVQAFTRFWQGLDAERRISFSGKLLVRVTESALSVAAPTLQQSFEILRPEFFLLTRPEALNPIFFQKNTASILEMLESRGIEFQIIDAASGPPFYLLLTRMITGFLGQGIPASTIFLVLSFPFIAFLVAFFRQVIGLSTYGVYIPIMIALAFQILGLPFGLLVLVVIVFLSFLLRIIFTKLDILYVPRAALMLSAIALSFLSVIWFSLHFGSSVSITLAIFPMLVMSTISEKFLSAQSEEGLGGAAWGALETIVVAIIAHLLIEITFFKELLLSFPEIIFIPLFGIFLLGKFTGLRLSEYIRFRSLLREGMEEE